MLFFLSKTSCSVELDFQLTLRILQMALLIRNGTVVNDDSMCLADVLIEDGVLT